MVAYLRNHCAWILVLMSLLVAAAAFADEADPADKPERSPTFGGKQFWSDELIFHEWRIQRHALTNYCRLLDDEDYRRAGGTFAECKKALEQVQLELKMPPMKPRVVLVLHGLLRSRQAMKSICDYLQENGDFQVLAVSYASSRSDMTTHATSLARVVTNLGDDVTEINFVAHSMGNLVVRRYLGGVCAVVPKQRRMPAQTVMIAPPNNGSRLAERFRENNIFRSFWGVSGLEIAELDKLEKYLATPPSFGIIAGGKGTENGNNPLIPGDDDFVVSVEETRLPGARDFLVVPALHGSIMEDQHVQECTLQFLEHGYFVADDQRQPIPLEVTPKDPTTDDDQPGGAAMTDQLPATGRIAGVDYGHVRIGVAITDAGRSIASPLANYTRRGEVADATYFQRLAQEEQIVGFVVGLPLHMSGDESQKSAETRKFGDWLGRQTDRPVVYHDERFSSVAADALLGDADLTRKQRQKRRDMLAAQIILTTFLEKTGKNPANGRHSLD